MKTLPLIATETFLEVFPEWCLPFRSNFDFEHFLLPWGLDSLSLLQFFYTCPLVPPIHKLKLMEHSPCFNHCSQTYLQKIPIRSRPCLYLLAIYFLGVLGCTVFFFFFYSDTYSYLLNLSKVLPKYNSCMQFGSIQEYFVAYENVCHFILLKNAVIGFLTIYIFI